MVRHRRRRRIVQEIPQASLPDVAFLLLIFFITSTVFAVEHGVPLLLPSARKSPTVTVEPSEVLRIQGLRNDDVRLDGAPAEVEQLGQIIVTRNAQRRAAGEAELIIIIEIDPEAEYRLMVEILDQVRAADSRRVSLQLLEGDS